VRGIGVGTDGFQAQPMHARQRQRVSRGGGQRADGETQQQRQPNQNRTTEIHGGGNLTERRKNFNGNERRVEMADGRWQMGDGRWEMGRKKAEIGKAENRNSKSGNAKTEKLPIEPQARRYSRSHRHWHKPGSWDKAPEGWSTPRRFAFVLATEPRASVLDGGGPPPLFRRQTKLCQG
jgi:hypothetical protein